MSKKDEEKYRKLAKIETKIDEVILKVGTRTTTRKVATSFITSNCIQGLHNKDIMKKLTALTENKNNLSGYVE